MVVLLMVVGQTVDCKFMSSCPLAAFLKVARYHQDVLGEGGDVDPLAKLRDGIVLSAGSPRKL